MSQRILLAGQLIEINTQVPELQTFEIYDEIHGTAEEAVPLVITEKKFPNKSVESISQPTTRSSMGWVGGTEQLVTAEDLPDGIALSVEGRRSCLISSDGSSITNLSPSESPSQLDLDLISGPALVQTLALQGIWCLHASAAMYKNYTFAFLGESGQGKSTLAGYLSKKDDWQLVADDILPVTENAGVVQSWPRFPQLKLPPGEQPGLRFPESLPIARMIFLSPSEGLNEPLLEPISTATAVSSLLSSTAGTRLFSPGKLAEQLEFCTRAAPLLTFHRLVYSHNLELLPFVRSILEDLC